MMPAVIDFINNGDAGVKICFFTQKKVDSRVVV